MFKVNLFASLQGSTFQVLQGCPYVYYDQRLPPYDINLFYFCLSQHISTRRSLLQREPSHFLHRRMILELGIPGTPTLSHVPTAEMHEDQD